MSRKLLFICAIGLTCCFGQADRAALTGTITDASSAAIPNASVKVVYPGTGMSRATSSSNSGVFRLSELVIGGCYVEVNATGFRPVRTEAIVLSVGETRTLDLKLEVAAQETSVQVRGVTEALEQSNASVSDVLVSSQLNELPVNGRDWTALMALVPGAVNTADGGASFMFFGTGGDDTNYRVDGLDASGVRDESMKVRTRLVMSQDAIAEFRVNSALYTAESGGTGGGQIEVVTKSGSNQFHGSAFEYFRNSIFDARSPFDPAALPPFRLNQFGATLGGPAIKNRTFFFISYEGFRQRLGQSLIGFVPSPALRAQALATSPAVAPIVNAFQLPNAGLLSPTIGQWDGQGSQSENENVGTIRVDHRFNDRASAYFRFTRTDNNLSAPNTLGDVLGQVNAPLSGVLEFLNILSPRSTNEFRVGANWVPWDSLNNSPLPISVSISGLSTPGSYKTQLVHGLSESIVDNFTVLRGAHTWKAGVEIKRVVISTHDSPSYSIAYASIGDFINDALNTASGSIGKPPETMYKTEYFGYIQDEWKIGPNLTANLGLRYDFFNEFQERWGRTLGFNIVECGGYCKYGLPFGDPATKNLEPRVSLAWSPAGLRGKTVIRVGGGIYYGDAQLGDQQGPFINAGFNYSLSSASTPGLSYPVVLDPTLGTQTAPSETQRHRPSEDFQQWGAQVQQILPWGMTAQVGYVGSENYHVYSRTYDNVINPLTGKRPLPAFNQISYGGDWGTSSYQGLLTSIQRTTRNGLFLKLNYTWSHSINNGSAGGGGDDAPPENVACRSACERGNSQEDARHSVFGSANYALPFGRSSRLWGGWEIGGVNSFRTGLPLTVTVSRKATALPDGNSNSQRPNLVPGVSVIPPGGQTINDWINPAAFSIPANGTWGNAGRNIVPGPGLFQIDAALSKKTKITERTSLIFRADVFNLTNHPELGKPNLNFSSLATFGIITTLTNPTPIGTGGSRSIQLALRLAF